MKRIVFLSKGKEHIAIKDYEVTCEDYRTLDGLDDEVLYIVSSLEAYQWIKERGSEALIYIKEVSELDFYSGATYFVMDIEETEADYFEKVYQRIHDLPWTMIETDRLILRETVEEDVDEFAKIYADPRMTMYMEKLYSIEEEKLYTREYRDKVYATQGFGIWTVIRKSDNRIIGRAGLTAREGFEEIEIGFAIGCEYQRQGYAKEAVTAICSFAMENNLGNLIALIRPGNKASQELVKRFGFSLCDQTDINGIGHEVWKLKSIG